ncbi:MFS transporter [Phreatobacter aquaticus]|uniref:MFS transporter n=2 Tax=Phreatobacter aquaticus TaxID=2570229 RepID=A0A4D7QTL1_9HYPH|nr:MFS transporter [Phreatobacter aquaticus]
MCLGQVGNLVPHVILQAIMARHLMPAWGLSATEAGLMASAYALGYMLAVPVLVTLTDRIDARLILTGGSAASGLCTIGLGLFADGALSAALFWGLAGMSFAGAYMPGLKAMTDRLSGADPSRAIAFYTSCFALGVGLSFLLGQVIADRFGWRAAFVVTGFGPLVMVAVGLWLKPVAPKPSGGRLLDFRPVFANRQALGYIFAYSIHCLELYGWRTWIVGFWSFIAASRGGLVPIDALALSFLVSVISMPASLIGNELAMRFGRHATIARIMNAASLIAIAIAIGVEAPPALLLCLVFLYAVAIPADSGALTAGMSAAATTSHRGATMALHTTMGFAFSAIGAWSSGLMLDLAGGPASASGWRAMFGLFAVIGLAGPLALWWSRR